MLFITTVTDELLLESSKRFHVFKPKTIYNEGQLTYQGAWRYLFHRSNIWHLIVATTVNFHYFQSDLQQKPTVVSPSTSASLTVNQLSTEAPIHLINDVNANYNKMSMVKSFSNESGMNNKWAEKCLEENEWDYDRAATCILDLKAKIPPTAFIHE